jgi:23S rRNA A2030 N6-methylase RlmJ
VPLLQFVERLQAEHPARTIAVLIPEVVKRRWWQNLLHTHRARRLRNALLRYGGSGLVVMNAPWYLEEPRIEEALVPEEARPQAAGNKPAGGRID